MDPLLFLAIPAMGVALMVARRMRRPARRGPRAKLHLTDIEIAALPDTIRLMPLGNDAHEGGGWHAAQAATLCEHGFEDAGLFAIEGIPDVSVRLLAHRGLSTYAALWDHAAVGAWFEFSTAYPGGRRWSITTLDGTGLEGRAGHTIVRDPGASVLELHLRACSERPMGVFLTATVTQAAGDFENEYTKWMAWRRAGERRSMAA